MNTSQKAAIATGLVVIVVIAAWLVVTSLFQAPQYNLVDVDVYTDPTDAPSILRGSAELAVADTPEERALGLGDIEVLPENTGMIFLFDEPATQVFWMKDVEYPIDILWVQDERIVGIEHNVQPELPVTPLAQYARYPSNSAVDTVIELPANWANMHAISVGDRVVYSEWR